MKLSATDLRGASSEKTVTITVKEPIIEVSTPVTASGVQNLISLFFLMVLSLRIKRIQLYH
ncbi:hypothetical protein ACMAZF_15295 [Psychrobium sp. nBUS_13]|uniref:hypothetical protein n=1 Tax=Psychrobium sp. nBUS_13 TaxID=3395319 RepID=UPI003EBE9336